MADFVARQLAAVCTVKDPVVLDPAVGDGELLLAFGKAFKRDCELNGFDMDAAAVANAQRRLTTELPGVPARISEQDFLEIALEHRGDSLFSTPGTFDLVICKPSLR